MKIIMIMAMTADGIIAKNSSQLADWTSRADKKAFIAETKKHGVIIMGQTTYRTIGRPLPGRLNLILTLEPDKFVADTQPGVLEFFKGQPSEVIALLEQRGYTSAVLGGGARTNAMFFEAKLVDELLITVEPKIFGTGLNFTEGVDLDLNLKLHSAKMIGDDAVILHYEVIK
ncbi:MAG: dihydrofolate reductase family protein [Patescibacteria group bacterium]|nr:dihydrofolate reductase family protein [Patescibacteria group bacterium]